jgi:hypothetical protein
MMLSSLTVMVKGSIVDEHDLQGFYQTFVYPKCMTSEMKSTRASGATSDSEISSSKIVRLTDFEELTNGLNRRPNHY